MAAGTSRRERKVVTVVFCDLVGFTSRAESMDPEDVEAVLDPYHQRLRAELERHGGTVEKFIGDAVMALFGAPTAHEDDAERAVRAAIAIRDWARAEDDVQVRIAATTGEALIRLDARPEAGEGMASGDVVNTAARLQNAAPVNGILVDETTYRATRRLIDYADAPEVEAKGKSQPVRVWEVVAAHSRFGVDIAHEARSELVGRDRELGIVKDAFARARHDRTPQLLTLVGVPGIGKSRLVYELSRIVDADPELITWRQGRCLAYGDGVTLWALGEIVKAQAGISEQDKPDDVVAKLRTAASDAVPEPDVSWVESHLLALVGLAEEAELGGNRRNEAFSAWRRFLEGLAEHRPVVLVFEDLHWADESLLDFVDELVDWLTDVPLLVVATARPELLERRHGWGGGKLNSTTLALAPLTAEQTAQLIGHVLGTPVLDAEAQAALLEQAGGNPLYAEQFAQLYVERGSTEELPLPETLQGIIAARLDGLSADEKGLMLDAAVVGKVFWSGALGRDESETTATFHLLERKGFVRRQRRSSVEGESELAFAHALVRDVAYGQIPRVDRAVKHRSVAEWIESLGRPEDHAEMRAYHWRSALDLSRASGLDDADLTDRARFALRDAGDRAFALNNYAIAASLYEDALELWPDADPAYADLLYRRARALHYGYDEERREQALEQARDALVAAGNTELAAEAESFLAYVAWDRGRGDVVRECVRRAEELVGDAVSPAAARVLATAARMREIAGQPGEGLRLGERAVALAEQLELDELLAHALTTVGMAKNGREEGSGIADMERGLEIALAANSRVAASTLNNLAVETLIEGNLPRAHELYEEGMRVAERLGDRSSARFIGANLIWIDFARGRWDVAWPAADEFIRLCEAGSPHTLEHGMRTIRGQMRRARGDVSGALADHQRAVALARERDDALQLGGALGVYAGALADENRPDEARALVAEVVDLTRIHGTHGAIVALALHADRLGAVEELRTAVEEGPGSGRRWRIAVLAALDGDASAAADVLADMDFRPLEAYARLIAGEHLREAGDDVAGEAQLERALRFYESVDAGAFASRARAALSAPQSESA
jgi:class 3 adenylate cyclase/tetratricopeptide (TPR) repeat protein